MFLASAGLRFERLIERCKELGERYIQGTGESIDQIHCWRLAAGLKVAEVESGPGGSLHCEISLEVGLLVRLNETALSVATMS
jgi:hypothetical protein